MADDIKSYSLELFFTSLLAFVLLSFASGFVIQNNGVFDTENTLSNSDYYSSYVEANNSLIVLSKTNPEVGNLGSSDSVATAMSFFSTTRDLFAGTLKLISFAFSSENGSLGVLLCIILTTASFFSFIYFGIRLILGKY